jgi:hypothetical protein
MHIATFLTDNDRTSSLYGCNFIIEGKSSNNIHAEISALKKIKRPRGNKRTKANLLVIQTSKSGLLRLSKPCKECAWKLYNNAVYKIKYVYYSEFDGSITKIRFNKLLTSPLSSSSGKVHKK